MPNAAASNKPPRRERSPTRQFVVGLARAFGGALIFSLPIFMTLEMWHLGFYADRLRLAVLLVVMIPVLVGLSHYSGFEPTFEWREDVVDAFVAYAVGFIAAFVVLALFGELRPGMPWDEIAGKLALQAVPGSVGALLAESQLGIKDEQPEEDVENCTHTGELFLMLVGALFLALSVAPTEEIILIACRISAVQGVALAMVSLIVMHVFVYAMEFRGQASIPEGTPHWSLLVRYTVPGYALALLSSMYLLWTFGRTEGNAPEHLAMATVVLGFPASIGAAAARLMI